MGPRPSRPESSATSGLLASGLLLAVLVSTATAAAQSEVRPSYRREQASRLPAARPPALKPSPTLPSELRIKSPPALGPAKTKTASSSSKGSSQSASGVRVSGAEGTATSVNYEKAAHEAGRWAAREVATERGRQEYFKVGVWQGLRRAVDSSSLGSWDQRQGLQMGRADPDARQHGLRIGAGTAEEWAREAAAIQVERQFHDLDRTPFRSPASEEPRYDPSEGLAPEPELAGVFHDLAPSSLGYRYSNLSAAFRAVGADPLQIYQTPSYERLYDRRWNDADRLFKAWKRDSGRSSVFRNLQSKDDQKRFKQVFAHELARQLASSEHTIRSAYEEGFDAGWDYGGMINNEWHYRLGYTEGFNQSVAEAAQQGFSSTYQAAYHRWYEETFRHWSESPHPDVEQVSLRDAGDDGIFEPGEVVLADYTLVNYGGAGGEVTVWLEGSELQQPVSERLFLPARRRQRSQQPISATISPGAEVRGLSQVDLRTGDMRRSAELLVSYPLELLTQPVLTHQDSLYGRAGFSLQVINRSRKPVPGVVDLLVGRDGNSQRQELDLVQPGATAEARFELEGLPPLAMLAGELTVSFAAGNGTTVHDEAVFGFTDAVTDLDNRDLLLFLLQVAEGQHATPVDIAALHRLMLRRLQADWQEVAAAKGNRYKDDNKGNGRQTALGDLVQSFLERRQMLRRPEVVTELGRAIEAMAADLPGSHPLLRRHFKRLARRLE